MGVEEKRCIDLGQEMSFFLFFVGIGFAACLSGVLSGEWKRFLLRLLDVFVRASQRLPRMRDLWRRLPIL